MNQRSLSVEPDREKIKYQQEMKTPIFCEGIHFGKRSIDF